MIFVLAAAEKNTRNAAVHKLQLRKCRELCAQFRTKQFLHCTAYRLHVTKLFVETERKAIIVQCLKFNKCLIKVNKKGCDIDDRFVRRKTDHQCNGNEIKGNGEFTLTCLGLSKKWKA